MANFANVLTFYVSQLSRNVNYIAQVVRRSFLECDPLLISACDDPDNGPQPLLKGGLSSVTSTYARHLRNVLYILFLTSQHVGCAPR